jgi:hypothetical protein
MGRTTSFLFSLEMGATVGVGGGDFTAGLGIGAKSSLVKKTAATSAKI